jgi:hypothetical protein
MSERERETTLALATDPPPDRLGERAMDLRNLMPASERSLRPRDGGQILSHHTQGATGRAIVVDAATGRTDGRLIVLAVRTTDPGGGAPLVTSIDGLGEWSPLSGVGQTAPLLPAEPDPFEWGDFGSATLDDLLILWVI